MLCWKRPGSYVTKIQGKQDDEQQQQQQGNKSKEKEENHIQGGKEKKQRGETSKPGGNVKKRNDTAVCAHKARIRGAHPFFAPSPIPDSLPFTWP